MSDHDILICTLSDAFRRRAKIKADKRKAHQHDFLYDIAECFGPDGGKERRFHPIL